MDAELREVLERVASALESLAQDPVIQVETMPPVCPHCEEINPIVSVKETEGTGPLGEIVIKATCMRCHREFIAVPVQMQSVSTISDAVELVNERNELRGFNGGKSQGT